MATRFSRNTTDAFIQQRRREDAERQRMVETTRYYAKTQAKADFELRTDAVIARNRTIERYQQLLAEHDRKEQEEEERRQQEEEAEMARLAKEEQAAQASQTETLQQRTAKMRARAQELKDKREAERLKIVDEKLKQKWRLECDDLRKAQSDRKAELLGSFREAQLAEKQLALQAEYIKEQQHAAAWEQDRLKKIAREQTEALEKQEREARVLVGLDEQVADLRQRRAQETALMQEEADLMRQHEATLVLEATKARQQKEHAQATMRKDLDRVNAALVKARAKEIQESIALDLKIVTDIVESGAKEREEEKRKKKQYIADLHAYRAFLQEQSQMEKERQAEMDRLYANESERQWAHRMETWNREQAARDRLLQQTIQGQKAQIERKLAQTARERELHDLESSAYAASLDLASLRNTATVDREAMQHAYAAELRKQVKFVEQRKVEEAEALERDRQAMRDEEQRYQETLQRELAALRQSN